jgi:hypothetical protein
MYFKRARHRIFNGEAAVHACDISKILAPLPTRSDVRVATLERPWELDMHGYKHCLSFKTQEIRVFELTRHEVAGESLLVHAAAGHREV